MPTKRRIAKSKPYRVTESAVEAFKAGDVLALHRSLALKPWQVSPLEVSETEASPWSPWSPGSAGALSWPLAVELRRELLEAAANAT